MDGVTYGNECRLNAYQQKKAYDGECGVTNYTPPDEPRKCTCDLTLNPVCSLAGVNYENACLLKCSHQIQSLDGPCFTPCMCEKTYDPWCGIDGRTYDNKCLLTCVRAQGYQIGECANLLNSCDNCS